MTSAIPFHRVAIVGTGLIGGSFGLALRRHFPVVTLIGFDRPEILERALALGAVQETSATLGDAVRGADLVYVAMPVGATIEALSEISSHANAKALVTDACSTKDVICRAANAKFTTGARFLGGHPMAGKEQPGIDGAENDSDERVRGFAEIVRAIGAKPVWCDAETHDWSVGIVSHLPQLVSIALAQVVQDETDETGLPLSLAGPGLKDLLRIAGSPYGLWRDIVLTNKDNISHALDRMTQAIDHLRSNLASKELEQEFKAANDLYAALRKPQ